MLTDQTLRVGLWCIVVLVSPHSLRGDSFCFTTTVASGEGNYVVASGHGTGGWNSVGQNVFRVGLTTSNSPSDVQRSVNCSSSSEPPSHCPASTEARRDTASDPRTRLMAARELPSAPLAECLVQKDPTQSPSSRGAAASLRAGHDPSTWASK